MRARQVKRATSKADIEIAKTRYAEQAANLQARADLMRQIAELNQAEGWKQVQAAERCGVTQPRINHLQRGRVSRFSLDALVNMRRRLADAGAWSSKRPERSAAASCASACEKSMRLHRRRDPGSIADEGTVGNCSRP